MRALLVALAAGAVLACLGETAMAACASDKAVAAYVADYFAKTPAKALAVNGNMADALCTQKKLVAALEKKLGPIVGYKAGLTSKAAQETFGASEPVRGVLLRDMLLNNGAEVPKNYGARPLFEADLVLVVGDAAINNAKTAEEAIHHISAVRPFIELPDLMYAKGEPINARTLTANNVAARLGVMGAPVLVGDGKAMLKDLKDMTVHVVAADSKVIAEAPGAAVLGNPINSVLWLRAKGVEFKAGDLISVGSFGPLMPLSKAKGGATVSYAGLPGNPSVRVKFK
jgi:2-keto-4-pentenoate hydratase